MTSLGKTNLKQNIIQNVNSHCYSLLKPSACCLSLYVGRPCSNNFDIVYSIPFTRQGLESCFDVGRLVYSGNLDIVYTIYRFTNRVWGFWCNTLQEKNDDDWFLRFPSVL